LLGEVWDERFNVRLRLSGFGSNSGGLEFKGTIEEANGGSLVIGRIALPALLAALMGPFLVIGVLALVVGAIFAMASARISQGSAHDRR
jgi:hypothetical protein